MFKSFIINEHEIKKSRKQFNCDICGTPVPTGNPYTTIYEIKNIHTGYFNKYKICSECNDALYNLRVEQCQNNNDINLFIQNKLKERS